ncbi:MAG: hypothetical protein R3C11_28095 [Planctomycetaceae bacterium]
MYEGNKPNDSILAINISHSADLLLNLTVSWDYFNELSGVPIRPYGFHLAHTLDEELCPLCWIPLQITEYINEVMHKGKAAPMSWINIDQERGVRLRLGGVN